MDEDFSELQQLWDDMQRLNELKKSVEDRKLELVLKDQESFSAWRRFLKEKDARNR